MRFRLSQQQQLLCDVIQASDTAQSAAAALQLRQRLGEDAAFDFAQRHEVACLLGHHVVSEVDETTQRWHGEHEKVRARMQAYMEELDAIAEVLDEHGITLVALKNGGIARGLYPCLGCCPMGDLDLLVSPRHFSQAHQLLVARGYDFEFRHQGLTADFDAASTSGSTEYHRELATGDKLWIDFQSRPVAGKWIRPDQEPDTDELLARAQSIPGTKVRLLAAEDNLLQVALHTAKHSYVRAPGLRLHTDVDRVVALQSMDWDLFGQHVDQYQVCTPVYFSLALAADLLGTPIPASTLQRFRPSGWKHGLISRWVQRAGLFEPQRSKFGRLGYLAFTALQYDDLRGLARAVFPEADWMRHQYPGQGPLPVLHLRRLRALLRRRFSP